ncbi:MAG TPA: TonB-dependent receptor plug domain-containing protein [Candidatus Eisenbacteria bacterium]|nr:TonB-dependent receptor plug domain-containing protein [Candidatus Eisenbacteria bacterium]
MSVLPFERTCAWVLCGLALMFLALPSARAADTGKIQGRIVATDSGEPIGFADVVLIPTDTTMRKVGAQTNADGTFLLEAAPGRYAFLIRMMSYAPKRVEGLVIKAGELLPFSTGLTPEAIQQEEVVVEAKALLNTEKALLSARRRASSVSDGVSSEQVRKSPDKDAAEVLRRVTGLSISEGKYVFVRGLGERYSSTEVDGVRLASPEQNKRVVPLDLLPANLLDHVVVQKTYTADRPGEFGGGDVQVRTKDFPGRRTWSYSFSQGFVEGLTFEDRATYQATRADIFGFGSDHRSMPVAVDGVVVPRETPATRPLVAELGKSFSNVWSPTAVKALPNANYSLTYGDEVKAFGRPLGMVFSTSLNRTYEHTEEDQRFFQGSLTDTLYDYAVSRWTESVLLGGLSALSYRLSPRHTLHVRGIATNGADDEVRRYEGLDHNSDITRRNTRLSYVQRSIFAGTVEGKHELPALFGMDVDWKLGLSGARRQQPDRREYNYDRTYYFEGDTAHWLMGTLGTREFGDQKDKGWGATVSGSWPYRLGGWGNGKLSIGYDHQVKERDYFYRRFNLYIKDGQNTEMPPESLFAEDGYDGTSTTGFVEDATLNDPLVGLDNYDADQTIAASFLSLDLPLGRRARANLGLRFEDGFQDVRSHALFDETPLAEGTIDERDWLPSGNLTLGLTENIHLRLAASRTVSRPDLNEMSPSPFLEYIGGMMVKGNTELDRAMLDNYDIRVEAFPGLGEVVAAGFFYKRLHRPIEQTIVGGVPPVLMPRNSDRGHNAGIELEARADLGRFSRRLKRLSLNANASFIQSEVDLQQSVSQIGTETHPLQGQANYLVNGALSYTNPTGTDLTVLLSAVGERLQTLAIEPLPDVYLQPTASLDVTATFPVLRVYRFKLSAKNLLDPRIQALQGERESSGYRVGRTYSFAFSYGS